MSTNIEAEEGIRRRVGCKNQEQRQRRGMYAIKYKGK
jgi:hypothetical protein